MSQALTLARPYARAAFLLAREAGALAPWSQALAFSARIAADPQAAGVLGHPSLKREQAVALLAPQAELAGFGDYLSLLADNRRLALLPEIAGLFEELRADAERVVRAKVTSAMAMPEAELDSIRAALRKRFGREVELETAVDASLIGGAVIDAGDVVIDGSLRGRLSRLQSALAG
ncbi:F0F1 ATP synthase subunit delta [Luteimonas sp. SDU101]|uniref:F0F1 ATP synthase subunit delta n=1 Tax=unclassified Luteimonas TaxID=2629088 RepID=UPI003EBFB25A